ncbi:GNAT family N-acetyltransferase [Acutalibacter sp. 1XD8-33]|uniref:GNAT family N-acetyltransferase n=1 Tax=Acutalibacter sp. 1XD8-33 TaxID=2320081 RepID=UPI0018F44F05|nr:GNAT family N-acetyltransferase [Acutalibacter sp. 1XD8-33]
MDIRKAGPGDLALVGGLARRTIRAVYPHYYPQGVVDFFLRWHQDERILPDILAGEVWLLFDGETAVGTVTLHGAEITRLYVPPECQGKGYGRALLDFAERTIGRAWGRIWLEASLPAEALYWKRGYRVTDCRTERQENGDVLCWDVMEKAWGPPDQSKITMRGSQA